LLPSTAAGTALHRLTRLPAGPRRSRGQKFAWSGRRRSTSVRPSSRVRIMVSGDSAVNARGFSLGITPQGQVCAIATARARYCARRGGPEDSRSTSLKSSRWPRF
jgi:hypothetical protein